MLPEQVKMYRDHIVQLLSDVFLEQPAIKSAAKDTLKRVGLTFFPAPKKIIPAVSNITTPAENKLSII